MIQTQNTTNNLPLPVTESTSDCCSTTKDGATICIVPEKGTTSACGCSSSNQEETAELSGSGNSREKSNLRGKIRGGVLFGIACLASPCCAPLYIPLLLVLLAGTPVAVWLSANVGWVYGALTIISIISFVLAFRLWPKFSARQESDKTQSTSKITYSMEK